jgi:hypothetical protein
VGQGRQQLEADMECIHELRLMDMQPVAEPSQAWPHLKVGVADLADDLLRHGTCGADCDETQIRAAGCYDQATLQHDPQSQASEQQQHV